MGGMLKPKPKVKAKATPAAPRVAPKFANMERPKFLPDAAGPGGPPPLGLPSGLTPNRTPLGGMTPTGARTPPKALPFGMNSPSAPGKGGDVTPGGSFKGGKSGFGDSLSASVAARKGGSLTPPGGKGGKSPRSAS